MNILLILFGFIIARFGARIFTAGEARGGQNVGAGIITLVIQVSGCALVIWGLIRIFS